MAMHPDSSFPLLAGDQAEVIRIFLELMRESNRTERPSEMTINKTHEVRNERRGWYSDEQLDGE